VTGRLATFLTTLGRQWSWCPTHDTLHMERFWKRANQSLPVAFQWQSCRHPAVAVESPEPLATFLANRRYLPRIPLLKRVLDLPGQTVCRDQLVVTIDNIERGAAYIRELYDRYGAPGFPAA
jgi:type IV secretory pathway protease TraF